MKSEFSMRKMRFLLRQSSTASVSRDEVKLWETWGKAVRNRNREQVEEKERNGGRNGPCGNSTTER